jgi:hypothetical protein
MSPLLEDQHMSKHSPAGQPDGINSRPPKASDDDDVQGHINARPPKAVDAEGINSRPPKASDDDDVEGHINARPPR